VTDGIFLRTSAGRRQERGMRQTPSHRHSTTIHRHNLYYIMHIYVQKSGTVYGPTIITR